MKLRPRTYDMVAEGIESAIRYGLNRAHKHTDRPTREHVVECVGRAVLSELCEHFDFGDEP